MRLSPDRVVKRNGARDGEVRVDRVRSGVIQLHDVGVLGHPPIAENRPERRNLVAADIENAGAERTAEPFVEAGAVVLAAEVRNLVVEMRECVRAVDHHVHSSGVRHVHDLAHRENLSGDVDHVAAPS